eukprot:scaffold4836_cov127-Isochrysis_galbana.AAC.7
MPESSGIRMRIRMCLLGVDVVVGWKGKDVPERVTPGKAYLSASSSTRMRTRSPIMASAMSSPTSRPGVPHATSHVAAIAASCRIRVPPMKAPTLTNRR